MDQQSGLSNGAGELRIDLASLYIETCAELEKAEGAAAELRGQKKLLERMINQAQRPIFSGDPLDDREVPAHIREERDILMSRLGEAQQGLSIADEAHQAPPAAARPAPAPRYIGEDNAAGEV